MKRSGAIGNKVAVTRRHIGEYDANRRLEYSRTYENYQRRDIESKMKYQLKFGGVAQLGEHLLCKQGVSGSIPLISTMKSNSFSTTA